MIEYNLLYSKSADLNVNLTQKNTFTEIYRIMFEQIPGHHCQAKLTHEINYHKGCLSESWYI